MAKISVIIPVYNAQEYLKDCLDSVLNQTFKDFEVICVNDNSTDESLNILKDYERKDNRLTILTGKGTGAGGARNVGLNSAKGEYLLFLDADDFFDPKMFEEMYNRAVETNSDIVVCDAIKYNTNTNEYLDYCNSFIPAENVEHSVISYKDIPENIFQYYSNNVWNKLYKHQLISEHNIKFQEIERSNDIFFVKTAIISAKSISCVNEKLVKYRIGHTTNLQSNNIKTPFEYTKTFYALKEYLVNNDFYVEVKDSFKKFIIEHINYNLGTLRAYPIQYMKMYFYLFHIYKDFGLKRTDTNCWSFLYILTVMLFSIRNYRGTGYKVVNFLGFNFKIKKG